MEERLLFDSLRVGFKGVFKDFIGGPILEAVGVIWNPFESANDAAAEARKRHFISQARCVDMD